MNTLIIFLKEPIPGKVKTRLGATTGHEEAAKRYKAMVEVLLIQLEGLTNTHVRFCYAPDDAGDAVSFWILPLLRGEIIKRKEDFLFTPSKNAQAFTIDFTPQGEGDLGARLERATEQAFADGAEKVAVMGTDCIHCGSRWINAAFLQTKEDSCVIGPSLDGGYYLLATARPEASLFRNIPWSAENTLSETKCAAEKAQLNITLLPELEDIDDKAGWDAAIQSAIGGKLKAALTRQS